MDFLKKRLKRLTSMGLALLLSASAFPATAFAASDSTSTLAEVTAKYIDAENGKEIAEQEIYSVTHEERQPQEIENYTYVDYTENVEYVYSHKDLTYIVGYPDESVRPDASMTREKQLRSFTVSMTASIQSLSAACQTARSRTSRRITGSTKKSKRCITLEL